MKTTDYADPFTTSYTVTDQEAEIEALTDKELAAILSEPNEETEPFNPDHFATSFNTTTNRVKWS